MVDLSHEQMIQIQRDNNLFIFKANEISLLWESADPKTLMSLKI